MIWVHRIFIALFVSTTIVAVRAMPAAAETLTWHIGSDYKADVGLEFYAEGRNHVWPGGGEVYVLRNDGYHSYRLDCQAGEWICFGAWVRGDSRKYWGVGRNAGHRCESCCSRCNGATTRDKTLLRPDYDPMTDVRAGGGNFYEMQEAK